jgi:hypothetical protein
VENDKLCNDKARLEAEVVHSSNLSCSSSPKPYTNPHHRHRLQVTKMRLDLELHKQSVAEYATLVFTTGARSYLLDAGMQSTVSGRVRRSKSRRER